VSLASLLRSIAELPSFLREALFSRRLARVLSERAPGLRLGRHVDIRGADRLRLGEGVQIDSFTTLHCGGTGWGPEEGGIVLGDHVYIGPGCTLFGAGGLVIEAGVNFGPGVVVTTHQPVLPVDTTATEQPLRYGPIHIRRGAMLGANATVLPGVEIGAHAFVGAGAVVTADVPAGGVALGVPARLRTP